VIPTSTGAADPAFTAPAASPVPDDPVAPARRAPALPPDERRAAIIDAAIPLLRQSGRRVTTREIADAAGIAEGTLFRVFDTKDDLIQAVVDHVMDVSDTIDTIRAIDGFQPLPERVRACVTILSTRLKSVFEIMVALHPRGKPEDAPDGRQTGPSRGTEHEHSHARAAHDARQAQLLDAIASVFEPSSTLLTCTPHRAAGLLRILAFSGAHPMIAGSEHLTADEITDVLLHGIVRAGPAGADNDPDIPPAAPARSAARAAMDAAIDAAADLITTHHESAPTSC
jgi:AcrR family transcriptional regulator